MDQESQSSSGQRRELQRSGGSEKEAHWTIPPLEDLVESNKATEQTQNGQEDSSKSAHEPDLPEIQKVDISGQVDVMPSSCENQSVELVPAGANLEKESDRGSASGKYSMGLDLLGQGWVSRKGRRIRYKLWELVGKHKRDILRTYVIQTRDDQQVAEDHFKDALGRLKDVYKYQTTPLETVYRNLMKNYRKCLKKAEMISGRIEQIKVISKDLFEEWEQEAEWIQNERLKQKSLKKLEQTQHKLEALTEALEVAEASMEPVLVQFYDQALYLKHNLNAQAVGVLKAEARSVEREIKKLVKQMNQAIKKADSFVEALP